MKITETALPGVLIIEPRVFGDERGFFVETWQQERYDAVIGGGLRFVQDNHSRSRRGILRGLHSQSQHAQGKLVRVSQGEVFDVAVDINPASPHFGKWVGVTLSDVKGNQLWIPPGYAHGFAVLSETADFQYKCTDYYHPQHEIGLLWNDPDVGIEWPISDPLLSDKDTKLPTLAQIKAGR